MATRMFGTQLSESKTRNTSTPDFAAWSTKARTTLSGIVGVAHRVRGAQQHLRHHVGQPLADVAQALPGAFLEEAVGHVEGGAAPAFDANSPGMQLA
jgi:hypothetical protein